MFKRFLSCKSCKCDIKIKKIYQDLNVRVIPLTINKDDGRLRGEERHLEAGALSDGPTQKDIQTIDKEINKKMKTIIDINNELIYNRINKCD